MRSPRVDRARVEIPERHLIETTLREEDADAIVLLAAALRALDSPATPAVLREAVGRAMAAASGGGAAALLAFEATGHGRLRLVMVERGCFVFEGEEMHAVGIASEVPACHVALGFAQGVVEAWSGGPALGSEVACVARGDEVCRFVVRAAMAS